MVLPHHASLLVAVVIDLHLVLGRSAKAVSLQLRPWIRSVSSPRVPGNLPEP